MVPYSGENMRSYLIKHFSQESSTASLFDSEDLLKSGINNLTPISKEICKNTLATLPDKTDFKKDFEFVIRVFSKSPSKLVQGVNCFRLNLRISWKLKVC